MSVAKNSPGRGHLIGDEHHLQVSLRRRETDHCRFGNHPDDESRITLQGKPVLGSRK